MTTPREPFVPLDPATLPHLATIDLTELGPLNSNPLMDGLDPRELAVEAKSMAMALGMIRLQLDVAGLDPKHAAAVRAQQTRIRDLARKLDTLGSAL